MRVLIVGGTRFIGAHAARRLVEMGADVTVFHRGKSDNPVLPAVRHITDVAAEYPVVRFPDSVAKTDWDVVVHMVMMGEMDARAAVQVFSGRAGLVMISSGDVYRAYGRLTRHEPGEPDPVPLDEDAPLRSVLYPYRSQASSLGAYAHDYEKTLAERVVREADTLKSVVLRLPKVYGNEDNANLATIYGFASQPEWRWTHAHVDNVAQAIALAATHPAAPSRSYNVGEAITPTMAERLARLPAPKVPAKTPPPFDYRQSMVADTARIRAELGFSERLDEAEAMAALARRVAPAPSNG